MTIISCFTNDLSDFTGDDRVRANEKRRPQKLLEVTETCVSLKVLYQQL